MRRSPDKGSSFFFRTQVTEKHDIFISEKIPGGKIWKNISEGEEAKC